MRLVELDGRSIGGAEPALIVVEIGQAHGGSFDKAIEMIDLVASTGADVVKFQAHNATDESTLDEPWRVDPGTGESRFEYWRRMEFRDQEWALLAQRAKQQGLTFMSSPFSLTSAALLKELVTAWKIGSGEITFLPLIREVARTQKPVLLSTGLATMEEIRRAVDCVLSEHAPCVLLQCTSRYPLPLEAVGLNLLEDFRREFGCLVGLSDHSGVIWPGVTAIALGASVVEIHMTLDKSADFPDASSSLTPREVIQLVEARDAIGRMMNSPIGKDRTTSELREMRTIFFRSVCVKRDLPAGTALTLDVLTCKKPATGIPAALMESVVGRRLNKDVTADRVLRWEDLDD